MNDELKKKFARTRRLFQHTKKCVYLNSGSYGPFSTLVKKAIDENVNIRMNADKDDSPEIFATTEELRKIYAKMIGAKKSEVGIGLSTTFGLNIAAYGLPLKKGDEILVSDIDFPAIIYTCRAAAEARGLKLKFIKSTNHYFDTEKLRKAITKKSKVLVLSFVQYFNGYKNDLSSLSEICREHGMFLVIDGIQGMGVEPVDVKKTGVDIFSSGCQKWMLSPQGCGFFYISEKIQKIIIPPFMSWHGVDWQMNFTDLFRYDLSYFDSARRFEMGYYGALNILGMRASADIFTDLGIKNIQEHNHQLIDRLASYINTDPFYTITSCMDKKHRSSIFSFTCRDYKKLHKKLAEKKIITSVREGAIRVSVHLFNNENDIDCLVKELKRFSKS